MLRHGCQDKLESLRPNDSRAGASGGGQVGQRTTTIALHVRRAQVLPHRPQHSLDASAGGDGKPTLLVVGEVTQSLTTPFLHDGVSGLRLHHLQHLLQNWLQTFEISVGHRIQLVLWGSLGRWLSLLVLCRSWAWCPHGARVRTCCAGRARTRRYLCRGSRYWLGLLPRLCGGLGVHTICPLQAPSLEPLCVAPESVAGRASGKG
mmetsp:Transcript_93031/g.207879  ORF Transcript_93031/g.207879 Transcript_93031/m.207879 type:complete len:205 (-) Transcript_93031:347-961(-)